MTKAFGVLLICLWVATGSLALAQEGSGEKLPETVVKGKTETEPLKTEVTTGTGVEMKLRDIPQSIQVIGRETLEEEGVMNLRDAVALSVPGIGFDTANNTKNKFYLRGFEAEYFRDGFREVSPARLKLFDVEQIEVLKGPSSVLYGQGQPGGMFNIISKKPLWSPMYSFTVSAQSFFTDRDEGFVDLDGFYDNASATLDIGGPVVTDKLACRLTSYFDSTDGWRNYNHEESRDLAIALQGYLTDNITVTLRTAFYDDDNVTDRGLIGINGEYPAVPETFYGSTNTLSETEEYLIEPTIEIRLNEDTVLRNRFNYTNLDRGELSLRPRRVEDNFIGPFGGVVGSDGEYETVEREQRHIKQDYDWFTDQLELIGTVYPGDIKNDYILGMEVVHINGSRKDFRLRDSDNLSDPVFHTSWLYPNAEVRTIDATSDHPLASGQIDYESEDTYYAAYIQDMVTLSEKWNLLGGVRYDHYEQKLTDFNNDNPEQKVTENVFSWRGGIVFHPVVSTSFYAVASRGFLPIAEGESGNIEDEYGNDFEPEENTLYEIGNKTAFFDERAAVTLSLFEGTRRNFPSTDPDTGETMQIGEQRTRGAEVVLEGLVTNNWSVQASYGYNDAEYVDYWDGTDDFSGKTPRYVPENTLGVWSSYNFRGRYALPLKVGGGIRWVGERFQDDENLYTFDSYSVVDLFAQYDFNKNTTLRLNLKNVLDEEYVISGYSQNWAMPGDPMSATLTLSVAF